MNDPTPRPSSPFPPGQRVSPSSRQRRPFWRRLFLIWLVAFLVVASVALERYLTTRNRYNQQVQEAVAEVDAVDPRWRLEDIEADRAQVPDERNSAKIIV